ncbi:MAG: hypothetical protein ABJ327_03195 [Litoreibacter sp.]
MVDDNKVLKVSYGTFSCSLEGFDDPLATVKDVAEYFRELAAKDRYFGTETPQLDPVELQRLAGKSADAHVEAKVSRTDIVFRHTDNSASEPSSEADMSVIDAVVASRDNAVPSHAEDVESVAVKLRRIREAASQEYNEDQHSEPFLPEDTSALADTSFSDTDMKDDAEDVILTEEDATDAPDSTVLAADEDIDGEIEIDIPETVVEDSGLETPALDGIEKSTEQDEAPVVEAAIDRRIVVQKITGKDLSNAREKARSFIPQPEEASPPLILSDENNASILESLQNSHSTENDGGAEEVETAHRDEVNDPIDDDDDEQKLIATQDSIREERKARIAALQESSDENIERLMLTTRERLDHDESSGRREAIAHLKAAVAATKADSTLAELAVEQEARDRDQYAQDLALVVHPEPAHPDVEDVIPERLAPLLLGDELRIDRQEQPHSGDEAPQQVADAHIQATPNTELNRQDPSDDDDHNIFDEDDREVFLEYATERGATELPDLLEVAAAYYTFVKETEAFSRPMLMRKIAPIAIKQKLTREQGLRSFGTLLYSGKLVRVQNGKFALAETSRFTPQPLYAGE